MRTWFLRFLFFQNTIHLSGAHISKATIKQTIGRHLKAVVHQHEIDYIIPCFVPQLIILTVSPAVTVLQNHMHTFMPNEELTFLLSQLQEEVWVVPDFQSISTRSG